MTMHIDVKELQRARISQGYSQRALARAAGVSSIVINNLEQGRGIPRPNTMKKICDALGIDVLKICQIN